MVDCLADLDKVTDLDPADIDTAEHELTTAAGQLGPEDLRRCAARMADVLDPDGTLRDEVVAHRRRNLTLRHQRDGRYRLEGDLTAEVGAGLFAILSPLARPRPTTLDGSDERDYPQRMHDALGDLVSRVLRSGGLPDSGGTPATVILHLDLADLLRRAGMAETSDGALIPTATALKLADEAEIVPIVLSPTGQQLFLGRTRRIATHTQTLALIARDGGCSFPNCTHPPTGANATTSFLGLTAATLT